MSGVEIPGAISVPAVVAWFGAAALPKHSEFAYRLIGFALLWSMVTLLASIGYGIWWLTQHICY